MSLDNFQYRVCCIVFKFAPNSKLLIVKFYLFYTMFLA